MSYLISNTQNNSPINIYDFAKLSINEKLIKLKKHGLLFDWYTENDSLVNLHLIENFFVEERVLRGTSQIIDIIPYKRGFQIDFELNRTESKKYIG